MPKQVIMYNLADGVTKEAYQKYVDDKKGPFFVNLPAVKSYTLLEMKSENCPYQYVAFVDTTTRRSCRKIHNLPRSANF
jgi:hypothetical protein